MEQQVINELIKSEKKIVNIKEQINELSKSLYTEFNIDGKENQIDIINEINDNLLKVSKDINENLLPKLKNTLN